MSATLTKDQIYEQARKRVKVKKDFYIHLTMCVLVNIMLVMIWTFISGGGYPWFVYPLGGWGIALVAHFLQVFVFEGRSNKAAIEKEAEKIRRNQR